MEDIIIQIIISIFVYLIFFGVYAYYAEKNVEKKKTPFKKNESQKKDNYYA